MMGQDCAAQRLPQCQGAQLPWVRDAVAVKMKGFILGPRETKTKLLAVNLGRAQ